jgi:hypothetical protein
MSLARAAHTATSLPDGRVLIAGGCTTAGCGGTPEGGRTEIFDPATARFGPGPRMVHARVGHTATKLPDGRVVFIGGHPDEGRAPLAEAEIFDPATATFVRTGSMRVGRGAHTATLLHDGRILVVGGLSERAELSTVEIFDPTTGLFSKAADLPTARVGHAAATLASGKVLVVGGGNDDTLLSTTLLYDPAGDRWQPAGPLARAKYKLALVALPDGTALAVGGQVADSPAARLTETEIFDPATSTFRPGPAMAEPRYKISDALTLLPDGRVVIAGSTGVEIYSSGSLTRVAVPQDAPERLFPAVAPLSNGQVLVTGGYNIRTLPTASALLVAPSA